MKEPFLCKEVKSANRWYLVFGTIFAIIDFVIIVGIIHTFISEGFITGLCIGLVLSFLLAICLICTTMLKMYFNRTSFVIYYAPLSNSTNIDTIKDEYSIHMVDEDGIIFTKKEDSRNYATYILLNDITVESMRESILAERIQTYEN